MEDGLFYGHLVYFVAILCQFGIFCGHFMVIWYILWPFYVNLVYFVAILWLFGIFCGHFMVIWYILWPFYVNLVYFVAILWLFGIYFPVLVYCTEKNLATLRGRNLATLSKC
jgi:hypothetical protein